MATVLEPSNGSCCRATNRRGEPCGRRATDNGYCVAHSGKLDMRAIGRRGGLARPNTKLRQALGDDAAMQEQAKDTIRRAMAGDAGVTRQQLDAARAVVSYRAMPPVSAGERQGEQASGKHVDLLDVVAVAAQCKFLSGAGALDVDAERELFERLTARPGRRQTIKQARSAVVERVVPPSEENAALSVSGCPPVPATNDRFKGYPFPRTHEAEL